MSHIDVAIADADKQLGHLDLHAAFDAYLGALRLILTQFSSDTVFATELDADRDDQQTKHFKNSVAVTPDDVERLFGLAHLCLTEVEDIMFGTVSLDDLEPYNADSDENEDEEVKPANTAPTADANATTILPGRESRPLSVVDSGDGGKTPPVQRRLSKAADFREHRLSRAHTIRSLERSGTWNSIRNSGISSSLRPPSTAPPEDNVSPFNSDWLLDSNRAHSPPPSSSPAPGTSGSPHLAASDTAADSSKPNPRMSGESLVWHFPSVPKRGAGAAPKAPPSTSQTPSPLQTISSTSSFENSPSHQPPPYRMLSSQPQPVVAPPRSETPPTRSLQRPAAYLPLIPTSPLVHQHRFISEQYNAAGAQLQALEKAQHTGRPSAATAGVLSQVRRLVETTGLAKRKLAQLSGSISEWDRKPLVEVSPAELAQAILCYDVDMFRGIKPTEIVSHAISNSTAVPDSVKRALDFSFFLHRIVQSTILDHDQPIDRASSIVRWILVAQALCIQRDFHATNAICCALSSPAVADLKKTWKLVSKKYRGIYADIPKALVLSTNGWKGYRHELNHVEKPCVPVVDALIHAEAGDATRMLEMCKEDEENWDRDVGPVGNPVNGIGPMHWLVTRRWMPAEQVERMSRAWEPRPEKPGSPAGSISSASSAGNENTDDALLRRFNRLGFSKK